MLTFNYGSMLGTQLEYVQNQLNLATAGGNGALVNGQTGGQLFGATNALGVQPGRVPHRRRWRLDRRPCWTATSFRVNLLMTKQTSTGSANGTNFNNKTAMSPGCIRCGPT